MPIDTGSPVPIVPNNLKMYEQKDIQPLGVRYQDVKKIVIKFLGKIWANIEYNGEITKLPILITQRNYITHLIGVNCFKQLPITTNKILLDEKTSQSEDIHTKFNKLFETNHTIKNTEIKVIIKPRCYPIQQKAIPRRYHLQQDVKNELDQLIKSGHFDRLETIEEDCFVSLVVVTAMKDKSVKIAFDARKLNECCVKKTAHAKHGRIIEPDFRRIVKECLWTEETSTGNQQTLQFRRYKKKLEWILPIPKRLLRSCRHTHNFPEKQTEHSDTKHPFG